MKRFHFKGCSSGRIGWLCAVGLTCLLLWSSALALKPEVGYQALPSHYGMIYQEVAFRTSDGLDLRGWFYPAQDTTGIAVQYVGRLMPVPPERRSEERAYATLDDASRPTIVVCCGDAGNMSHLMLYAYHFCTQGFNVLTFDWRGFGESAAWPLDGDQLVYAEFLLDYAAAVDFAKARPETDPDRIGLFGFSTGAYLSMATAAARDDIAALVGRGMMTSFADVLPLLHELSPDRDLRAPEDYPAGLLPAVAAGRLSTPTLLIVGENDVRTPVWMSQTVYERLAGPRELWVVPGADHGGADAPEYTDYPEFFVRASAFYEKFLRGSPISEAPASKEPK